MPPKAENVPVDLHDKLIAALECEAFDDARSVLGTMSAADVAHLLECSPPKSRNLIWQMIALEQEGEILHELPDDIRSKFLSDMDTSEVLAITEGLETDDIADILQQLPNHEIAEVLQQMDLQDRQRVEQVLTYPKDTAGGLMNTDTITVRSNISVDVVLRYLRRHREIPDITDSVIVVDRGDIYIGLLPLSTILVSDPRAQVCEIMQQDLQAIPAHMSDSKVAQLFERNNWVSAPVIDEDGRLAGRITIDDVVDVIREDADHSLMSMAGLDEDEDTFAPALKTTPRRAIWLGINLITAFIASAVINIFEGTIDKVVTLAILMPVVASMGGVAGSQTLTVVVRGMALGHIDRNNSRWLLNREFLVSIFNGSLWALVAAVAASLWFSDWLIGAIMAMAMAINLVVAAMAGTLIPLTLKRMGIDPALAGSVVLTTVTDVVGFMSFLGLATVFYA
ncbi:MAG: magnesium transporter [Halieaceae bacterium]|jgi:magnesium transporter